MDSEKIESGFRTLGPIPKNAPLGLRKGACDLADFPSNTIFSKTARETYAETLSVGILWVVRVP